MADASKQLTLSVRAEQVAFIAPGAIEHLSRQHASLREWAMNGR